MSENRIEQLSITPTIGRQTPKRDFGQYLAQGAAVGLEVGSSLLSSAFGGRPVTSAAVSALGSMASALKGTGEAQGAQMKATGVAAAGAGIGGLEGQGEQWDLLRAQSLMRVESERFNASYLQMQNEMQRESREFNAVSNILKVRHDSAKAAINNIR
jgi:hypothetical protein